MRERKQQIISAIAEQLGKRRQLTTAGKKPTVNGEKLSAFLSTLLQKRRS